MSMPNDKEHQEIIKYYSGPSTDKMKAIAEEAAKRKVSEAEERILKENVRPLVEQFVEHDGFISEHESFISKIKRNFLGIVKG
jgi:hypothetical protein